MPESSITNLHIEDPILSLFKQWLSLFTYYWSEFRLQVVPDFNDREVFMLLIIVGLVGYLWVQELRKINFSLEKLFTFGNLIKFVPGASKKLQGAIDSAKQSFKNQVIKAANKKFIKSLPEEGWRDKAIIKRLDEFAGEEMGLKENGMYSGSVFCTQKDVVKISEYASNKFLFTNMLFYQQHPRSRQLEMEVVAMALKMYNAPKTASGFTSFGGSESILLSCLAHKRFYQRKGITQPEIIFPETAHAAFYKACDFFDIKPIILKLDMKTRRFTAEDYEKKITKNTIMMVCSCPNLIYGTIDPVAGVDKLAGKHDIGLTLDCCMGGFLLPFVNDIGVELEEPIIDFRLKNVTSIICDPHKYGLAPKGCSILMFSRPEIQKALYYGLINWCGYIYGTTIFTGSRSSGFIASAWAVMMLNGKSGYIKSAKKVSDATIRLAEKVNAIPGVKTVGEPKIGNIGFISDDPKLDVYHLGNYCHYHGWKLPATPKYPVLRLTIHPNNIDTLDELARLMKEGAAEVCILTKHRF